MGLPATEIAGLGIDNSLDGTEGGLGRTGGGLSKAGKLEAPIRTS